MPRHSRTTQLQRSGAVLVETAILMPICLVIVWGTVEIGRAVMVGQLASNAARVGARAAILEGSTNSAVIANVQKYVADSFKGVQPAQVSVNIKITPGIGNRDPHNQLAAANPRDLCQVTVRVPYHRVANVSPRFLAGTNLCAACALHHQ